MRDDEWAHIRRDSIGKLMGEYYMKADAYDQIIALIGNKGPEYVIKRLNERVTMTYALAAARPFVVGAMAAQFEDATRALKKIDGALAGTIETPHVAVLRACLAFAVDESERRGHNDKEYEMQAEPLIKAIGELLEGIT